MIDYELQTELSSTLHAGEKLVWAGKPKKGILFSSTDIILIPFSMLWGGFAIAMEILVIIAHVWIAIILIFPFVVVGLQLMIGRFFFDARKRARTIYGLTRDRLIIKTGEGEQAVKSMPIASMSDMTLDLKKDGTGSIQFGLGEFMSVKMSGSDMAGKQFITSVDRIYDVRELYDKIIELQRHNKPTTV
jgi:hypothetical protein